MPVDTWCWARMLDLDVVRLQFLKLPQLQHVDVFKTCKMIQYHYLGDFSWFRKAMETACAKVLMCCWSFAKGLRRGTCFGTLKKGKSERNLTEGISIYIYTYIYIYMWMLGICEVYIIQKNSQITLCIYNVSMYSMDTVSHIPLCSHGTINQAHIQQQKCIYRHCNSVLDLWCHHIWQNCVLIISEFSFQYDQDTPAAGWLRYLPHVEDYRRDQLCHLGDEPWFIEKTTQPNGLALLKHKKHRWMLVSVLVHPPNLYQTKIRPNSKPPRKWLDAVAVS